MTEQELREECKEQVVKEEGEVELGFGLVPVSYLREVLGREHLDFHSSTL